MPFTQGRALIVGVGKYQYVPAANVAQTTTDAVNFANALTTKGGYPGGQVTVLQDGAATHSALVTALQQLAAAAQPSDIALFFYSGHGDFATDNSFYLTTTDTQLDNGKIKVGTGLSQADFLNLLRQIKAQQLLVIINSCFSGTVEPSLGFNTGEEATGATLGNAMPDAVANATLATGEGRVIITACRNGERSWVGAGTMTIFGQTLVNSVNGNAKFSGPYVNIYDLYNYLFDTVPPLVQQIGQKQEPVMSILQLVGKPPIMAQNPNAGTALGFDTTDAVATVPHGNVRQVDPTEAQNQLAQIIGTQNNVGRDQYNAGRDQFIGNRNVSTGGGAITDYGGVGGSVNTGSGSQTTVSTGNISGNSGQVAVGSGINQNSGGGAAAAPPPANPAITNLLNNVRALRDKVNAASGIDPSDLSYIAGQLTTAIRLLRDNPNNPDLGQVNAALTNAADGLGDAGQADLQRQAQGLVQS